jgi:hypothetical protein
MNNNKSSTSLIIITNERKRLMKRIEKRNLENEKKSE